MLHVVTGIPLKPKLISASKIQSALLWSVVYLFHCGAGEMGHVGSWIKHRERKKIIDE